MASPFDPSLSESDPEIARLVADESRREHDKVRLIASENYASRAVMETLCPWVRCPPAGSERPMMVSPGWQKAK